MADLRILATGLGFPEGPVVCADGSVVLVELRNQRCSRVAPDGTVSLFSNCGGGPNGLAVGPDGFLYLCNNGGNRYLDGHPLGMGPHPDYQLGYITEFSPAGNVVRAVKMPEGHPTNIALGGADMRSAYITLSSTGQPGVMQRPEPALKLDFA